ncbi:hypothetical protein O0I10_005273 [Lichtheimia ornata]|uniref:Globin domain-containing protein n=1 Tax=Lichtheimia ornata TaxID=688661 RepID=A0AAD7V5I9_9FUNG|nr:uncharacterized protein O0I10_005273 [Lichtheimia ornata]KAJ8658891.1 hypothetical protein O0I10_005273 [Lichtheimia ornata]
MPTQIADEPPLPPSQAQLNVIRDSWERVLSTPINNNNNSIDNPTLLSSATSSASAAFHHAFFEALFALDPNLTTFFPNVKRQARALTGIVSYVVRAPAILPARYRAVKSLREMHQIQQVLDDEEERWMCEQLKALGARHAVHHQIQIDMLDHVGPALVSALYQRLDTEFSPAMRDAWLHAFNYVLYYMKQGFQSQLETGQVMIEDQTRGACTIQ